MRALLVFVVLALAAGTVAAQPADVPALIKLIETQPSDMDRSTWKEKRRDAARKLAQSKDKRGVPVLIRLAESETFDIIGEIAIEGLGNLGDHSAVPALQAIVADTTRDKATRELARKALGKLGAPEVGKPAGGGTTTTTPGTGPKPGTGTTPPGAGTTPGTGTSGDTTGTGAGGGAGGEGGGNATGGGTGLETGAGGGLLGEPQTSTVEGVPDLADDVIAASERLTFAAGTAGLRMQRLPEDENGNRNQRIDFDADVAAFYQKRLDTETKAYALTADAHVVAGYINPEGRGYTRGLLVDVLGEGEARFYANKVYGVGKAAAGLALQYVGYNDDNDPGQDIADSTTQFDLQVAIGGGFGRVVDVGAAIRVRRLASMLDGARALGKPIDAATAKKLQLTWWALRGERSQFRALIATIAVLREAGILLGEPNAVIVYELLTVLRDTQLYVRPQGFDAQLVFSEGYLKRPTDDADNCLVTACGRVEQVIATVGYAQQLEDDKLELSGEGFARYRLFAPDDETSPWAVGAGARMRRFTYGEHGDPFGAFDLAGRVRLSNDGVPEMFGDSDTGLRIEGELGFTYWVNQASGIRLAAQVAEDAGALFLGARLEATYGLLDGVFAR